MNIHKLRISCNLSLYQNWRTYKYSDRATAQAPLCDNNCKCNIFTSDTRISPPWLEDRSGDTAEGAEDEATLEEMLGHARLNKVPGVRRLSLAEVAALEPGLCLAGVSAALHSAEETIVDSWLLSMTHVHGLAVAGVEARTRCEVTAVARTEAGDWAAATSQGTVRAACVINCAGNFGDNVERMGRDVNMNIIASSDT